MIDRDTIIRLAREVADPNTADVVFDDLITLNFGEMERFAALVAAAEREACFQIALTIGDDAAGCRHTDEVARRIRARSEA